MSDSVKEVTIKPCVYVLELDPYEVDSKGEALKRPPKYYVGISLNLNLRLGQHFNEDGSKWTKTYKPVKLIEVIYPAASITEKTKTLEYMKKYGWENVRGYSWCQVDMKNPPNELNFNFLS